MAAISNHVRYSMPLSPEFSQSAIAGASSQQRWTKGVNCARDRLEFGIVVPEWAPSFQIELGAQVFAIGSCFARNIELALLKQGITVTSAAPESDLLELRTNLNVGLLNQYNPVSIHQELEWAAGFSTFPTNGLLKLGNEYVDPYLRGQAQCGSRDQMQTRRDRLRQYFAQAFAADVVILTLGLTETWFDRQTRRVLAEVPSPRLWQQYRDRFEFKALSYAECEAVLKSIGALLKKYGKPNQKVVVTVSPVALARTFSGQDILVANMMSKSTLRTAAGAFAAHVAGVDYFPSYEAAMLSDPALVWQRDRRNVTDFMVTQIIQTFTQRYGLQPTPDATTLEAQRQAILQARRDRAQKTVTQLAAVV